MKRILILIFMLFPAILVAQYLPGGLEEEENANKKKVKKEESRMFADYRFATPIINKTVGVEMGFDFGSTFGGDFFMGFGMHSLLSKNIEYEIEGEFGTPFLRMSHICLLVGYDFDMSDYLYFTPSAEFAMTYISYGTNGRVDVSADLNGQWGFSIMPKFAFGVNLGGSTWLETQGGFRFMSGFDFKSIKSKDLQGLIVALAIKTYF